jgi:hypothetical protein
MDVDTEDLQRRYDRLAYRANPQFLDLSQNSANQAGYSEDWFHDIVDSCQTFGAEVWTTISELRKDAAGKEEAITKRMDRMNEDVKLLKIGEDYWKQNLQEWSAQYEHEQSCLAAAVHQQVDAIQTQVQRQIRTDARQLHNEDRLGILSAQVRQIEEQCKKETEKMSPAVRRAEQRARMNNVDLQTVYKEEMKSIQELDIPSQASLFIDNHQHSKGQTTQNRYQPFGSESHPNDKLHGEDEYMAYYERSKQLLGADTPLNRVMAKSMADQEIMRRQITKLAKVVTEKSMSSIFKRLTRRPPPAFDGESQSNFSTWKEEVESYFDYYEKEFLKGSDKIAWIEGILSRKPLCWHQARRRGLAEYRTLDNWNAYWEAAVAQFRNKHEITECSQKIRHLRYKGDISDYLVKLRDLNRKVRLSGQYFRDVIQIQVLMEMVDMMFIFGELPEEDDEFLRILEIAWKRVEQKNKIHATKTGSETGFHKHTNYTGSVKLLYLL